MWGRNIKKKHFQMDRGGGEEKKLKCPEPILKYHLLSAICILNFNFNFDIFL